VNRASLTCEIFHVPNSVAATAVEA